MNRFIQFTETDTKGQVQRCVMQYAATEMDECFTAHENIWLTEGKMVERETMFGKTVIVDLQAWFARTSK